MLFTRDWGFSPRDVRVPIHFWHGDADNIVPLHHGEWLASLVPGARLLVRRGESHLGTLEAAGDVLDTLLAHWPDERLHDLPGCPRSARRCQPGPELGGGDRRCRGFTSPDSLLRDPVPRSVLDASGRLRPPVPLGRRIELPGRGTMFVREVEGPPGAPTVVLLHGWMASGGLNWFRVFEALGREFRVLAPDLRGHARGLRARQFQLADCADDVAAMCRVLHVDPVLVAGYSMGGPVAQLLWRRHPELVAGLVLCATSDSFVFGPREGRAFRLALAALGSVAHVAERALDVPASALRAVVSPRRPADFVEWATAELGRHSVHMLVEAALSVRGYNARDWISRVDVPTGIVVTTRDMTVSPSMQFRLAEASSSATVHPVDGGHSACVRERFVAPFVDACTTVASRAIG